jgi:hypothetical protein
MGRRGLARLARRSAVLFSGSTANVVAGEQQQVVRLAHSGLLASRGTSIRSAVDKSTPATRDALSAPRSLVSALPARQEEVSDEETVRVVSSSDASPEVITDHVGAISMVCDDNGAEVCGIPSYVASGMEVYLGSHRLN